MKKYLIENIGCDEITYTEIELTEEELKTILKFARMNNKNSENKCMPVISIYDEFDIKDDHFFTYDFKDLTRQKEND